MVIYNFDKKLVSVQYIKPLGLLMYKASSKNK